MSAFPTFQKIQAKCFTRAKWPASFAYITVVVVWLLSPRLCFVRSSLWDSFTKNLFIAESLALCLAAVSFKRERSVYSVCAIILSLLVICPGVVRLCEVLNSK